MTLTRRWWCENKNPPHNKQYFVGLATMGLAMMPAGGHRVLTAWGRIGQATQEKYLDCRSYSEAMKEIQRIITERSDKGYVVRELNNLSQAEVVTFQRNRAPVWFIQGGTAAPSTAANLTPPSRAKRTPVPRAKKAGPPTPEVISTRKRNAEWNF